MAFFNQPLSARRTNRANSIIFFGAFTVFGGAFFFLFFVKPVLDVWAARSWTETHCSIVSSRVREFQGNKGPTYSVDIVYSYPVGGQEYQARRYDFMGGSSSGYDEKQAVVDRYPPGMQTVCYVNPSDPDDAVLDRGYPDGLKFGLIALIFPAAGIGGLAFTWNRSKQPGANLWSPPVIPSIGVATAGMTAKPEPGNIGLVTMAPPGTTRHDRPVELAPTMTTGYKALVNSLGLIAFGGGLIAVIASNIKVLGTNGSDGSNALTGIVILGVITLILLISTTRAFMQLSDPRIHVRIAPGTVRLGQDFTLEWEAQGGRRRLSGLRIAVQCQEESVYQSGKTGGIAISVCYRADLVNTQQPDQLTTGTLTMRMPDGVMHSFNGGRNRISWKMRVIGTVPGWIGVKDEYPLVILPEGWEGVT